MLVLFYIITISYILLLLILIVGFKRVEEFNYVNNKTHTNFSVLIPFRNEAQNLPRLLNSIFEIQYPKHQFEIIFIDDFSTDNSKEIILQFAELNQPTNISIIENKLNSHSPKKAALELGVNKAKFEWILTTDADCILPKFWLKQYSSYISLHQPYFIAGPVSYLKNDCFLNQFQFYHFISLIGSTIGSFGLKKPILCNGANLAYKKSVFKSVKGYKNHENIVSGDDVFLLEKIQKLYPQKVTYLKSFKALVYTEAQPSLKQFVHQQIRWVSKSSLLKNYFSKIVGILVFLANSILILSFFKGGVFIKSGVAFWCVKLIIDFTLIYLTTKFFKQKINIINYFISGLLYPFFSIVISLLSFFTKFEWKGRIYKR